jgi:hypothetical protein
VDSDSVVNVMVLGEEDKRRARVVLGGPRHELIAELYELRALDPDRLAPFLAEMVSLVARHASASSLPAPRSLHGRRGRPLNSRSRTRPRTCIRSPRSRSARFPGTRRGTTGMPQIETSRRSRSPKRTSRTSLRGRCSNARRRRRTRTRSRPSCCSRRSGPRTCRGPRSRRPAHSSRPRRRRARSHSCRPASRGTSDRGNFRCDRRTRCKLPATRRRPSQRSQRSRPRRRPTPRRLARAAHKPR